MIPLGPPAEPSPDRPGALPKAFETFVAVVERLRRECPWDREQTHASIRHLLIEEAYETVEAIDRENWAELRKELGDLFLHVVFHSVMAAEAGTFTLEEVIAGETEKLVRRHPHVFGEVRVSGTAEVLANWEQIKVREGEKQSVLEGMPATLPALLRAQRIQEKVGGVGFDFPEKAEAWKKVVEELGELEHRSEAGAGAAQVEEEFGDLLFALVNYARFLNISPENALRQTNDKFARRFEHIERRLRETGRGPAESTLEEMDRFWDEAKRLEREK